MPPVYETGKVVVEMEVEKTTKNKVRYQEPRTGFNYGDDDTKAVFPFLYIRQEALKAMKAFTPNRIRVTVEVIPEESQGG